MSEQSTAVEQPEKDSTEVKDQVTEQAEAEAGATSPEIDLDGEKVTADQVKEWKNGYMRHEDYTKKTQELAEAKRLLARTPAEEKKGEEMTPEVKAAVETLKKAGMVTKEDLMAQKAAEEDQKRFRKLLRTYPDLKTHEKALKQIGLTDNRAWEDIAKEYGFLKTDKVAKAKASTPIVGSKTAPTAAKGEKSVKDMTPGEYEAWKKQNLGKGQWA